ncbi:non-ribosomal peptide synthetase [Chitinophaga solisilvae]|uniref:non-ribosomal peptide synthetase n=1 Tax=Chitinophaga solisilvae TaxID=1233460 RepID=UPI00136B26F8|nr:non-ribosomal peptide synthetase [Chitinophaga solisilvae]
MIADLYTKLKALKVNIRVVDGRLDIQAPKGALNSELLAEIKKHKEEIIAFINFYKKSDSKGSIIPKAPDQEGYPLSAAQRRLWILSQSAEGNIAYNMSGVYQLEGALDAAALNTACESVVSRHESLRTVFREDGQGNVLQVILQPAAVFGGIQQRDLRDEQQPEEVLKAFLQQDSRMAFDLTAGLLRLSLYQLTDTRWVFSYVIHHIISDGWSMGLLINEVMLFYNAAVSGTTAPLEPLTVQYRDFSAWQQAQLGGQNNHKQYWMQQFEGELPVLELPACNKRPPLKTYNGALYTTRLDAAFTTALKEMCQQLGGTLYMGLLAGMSALFYRYTGQEDMIIGSPVAGREHADLEDQIGLYANTLALRCRFSGDEGFSQLFSHIRQTVIGAFEHQVYPFDELVESLQLQRDISRNPLFDVQVVLQHADNSNAARTLGGLEVAGYGGTQRLTSVFDIVFNFVESGDALDLRIVYNSDIYDEQIMAAMVRHLTALMTSVTSDVQLPVSALNYIGETEQQELLQHLSGLAADNSETVISRFRSRVQENPDATAVVAGDRRLTYRQLDEKSDLLCHYLQELQQPDTEMLTGVMMERSDLMIIALLGILKAGAVYVPIDVAYPEARREFIISDTGIGTLITQTDYLFDLSFFTGEMIALDIQLDVMQATAAVPPQLSPEKLAYIIYTSGSTGLPKGVMITHAALQHSIAGQQQIFQAGREDLCLQFFSASFDVSVFEIFLALTTGATLYIAPEETRKNLLLLEEYIAREALTIATLPAAYIKLLQPANIPSVKKLITGGEAVLAEKAAQFLPYTRYFNAYGPTETAICATIFEMLPATDTSRPMPVGKPIDSTCIYILDRYGRLLPDGITGEIGIGGNCLARGYFNRPELTAEKFVPDPYIPGGRIYKTGDMGRRLRDGNIEFTGRKDEQVKVRGYRIEPGEVESALQQHESISAAVVIAYTSPGDEKDLAAYFVSDEPLSVTDLRGFLADRLPAYMMPAWFVQLDELPLTTNGKADKRKLPAPAGLDIATGKAYRAPSGDIEKHLVAVYEEVLKKQPVGMNDDFFLLGGDSIKSIQIVSRLKQKGYTLTIQDILLYPVIGDLARHVGVSNRTIWQHAVKGPVALSPVQQFFFSNNAAEKHHYNQSVLLKSNTAIHEAALKTALDKLVQHHDALRMVYRMTAAGWEQENLGEEQGCTFEVLPYQEQDFISYCNRIQAGFNLETGPLFHAALFRDAAGDRLLLAIHHLVMDGVSWRILLEDLSALYEQAVAGAALNLPLKTDSFKYWMEKQAAYAVSKTLQREAAYWADIASQPVPRLSLDNPGGSHLVKDTGYHSFLLDEALSNRLFTACYSAYRTDTNDILLTALSLALSAVFGTDRVLITLEGHGREQIGADVDVTRTIGWFTSFYPVLFNMEHRADNIRQLIEIKGHLHRVPNKGIGYGILRYMGGHDLPLTPEVTFNYLGDFGHGVAAGNGENLFSFSGEAQGQAITGNWERTSLLDISGIVTEGRLRMTVGYSTAQYQAATMERLMNACREQLVALIEKLSAETVVHMTPSDLSYKELSVESVMALNATGNVEDVYVLSPMQEGLYYHWLQSAVSSAYFEQVSYEVKGMLDETLLKKSYQQLENRHSILRTCFTQEYGRPLQIVQRDAGDNFYFRDISGEQDFSLKAFREADRQQGFRLDSGSQMRLTVLKKDHDLYEFIWSHHHILMDGWCGSILVKEFLQFYHNQVQGTLPVMNAVVPYTNYIQWLQTQDPAVSLQFWKDYLSGYDMLNSVPGRAGGIRGYSAANELFFLKGALRGELRTYCAGLGITENIFFQVLWGLLLGKYNNTADVVFGTVVSGRPAELKGVEEMIGLFINTVPVRIQYTAETPVSRVMTAAQQSFISSTAHQHTHLADIQAESALSTGLFDHMLVYESFPVQEVAGPQGSHVQQIEMSAVSDVFDQTEHDFSIVIVPGERIAMRIRYNAQVYDKALIENIREDITELTAHILRAQQPLAGDAAQLGEARRAAADPQLQTTFNATISEEF